MKLFKNLSINTRANINKVLSEHNFKEIEAGNFVYGNRLFRFQSDCLTGDFGLETYVDVEKILSEMHLKTKHTSSLCNKIDEENSIDTAFLSLGWKVTDMISEFDFTHKYGSNNNEDIYEVEIRGKKHLVYNDKVYEGELSSISELFKKNAIEILNSINPDIINELRNAGLYY